MREWILGLLLCLFASVANAQFVSVDECYTDPVTGRQVCPLKKAAAATGKVLQAAANVVTPNSVALPMQQYQHYSTPAPVQSQSVGWSKSWHVVHGQPVRNGLRRFLGR